MKAARGGEFRVSLLSRSVYLPAALFSVGQGAAIPVIALVALDLGASPAVAGVMVALRGLGTMVFDVPAGALVARFGEQRSMVGASTALAAIALAIAVSKSVVLYGVLIFLMGAAWSIWLLARLAFATEVTPLRHRGRVMSMIGGMGRIGHLAGPILGGVAAGMVGLAGPFFVQAVLAAAAAVVVALSPEPEAAIANPQAETAGGFNMIQSLRSIGAAGFAAVAISVVRSARQAVIPLWGDQIGLGASAISFIFAASAAIEVVVFYPMGTLMDRMGRKWAAVPCLFLLSIGMILLPLAGDETALTLVALLLGLANGLGTGIIMTLGSDLSPPATRSQFLGLWRLITDAGQALGPVTIAAVTATVSLAAASVAVGGIGLAGVAAFIFLVQETLVGARPDDP